MTYHVAVDTSVLHGPPRFDGAHFRALDRLVELGAIELLLPEIVQRELMSQIAEHRRAKIAAATRALSEARHWLNDPADIKDLDAANVAIVGLQKRDNQSEAFGAWVTRTAAVVLPLMPDHSKRALDGYFAGTPPFRKVRSREDLLDALILEALRDAVSVFADLRLVSADQRLRDAVAEALGVETYASLADYLASDEVLAVFRAAKASENLVTLRKVLPKRMMTIATRIRDNWINALAGFSFESSAIPDDNNEATIQSVDEPSRWEVLVDELEFLGDGSVLVPVVAACEVEVFYYIFKSEYHCLSERRTSSMSISDWNDHYYMATEMLPVAARVSLAIDFRGLQLDVIELSDETFSRALEEASIEVDEVESIEVEASDSIYGAR